MVLYIEAYCDDHLEVLDGVTSLFLQEPGFSAYHFCTMLVCLLSPLIRVMISDHSDYKAIKTGL